MAGILGGDEVHLFENTDGPEGHVLQVTDGSSDYE
jgi:hypothetical protein